MAYEVKQNGASFSVVAVMNGGKTIARVLDTFTARVDAERMLSDLAGWRF